MISHIQETYQTVKDQVQDLELDQEVKLLAVTKYVDADVMEAMYESGIRRFGENRADALIQKQVDLEGLDIEWHFIGHLQTRPVKKIINKIDYLHSLDRLSLAKEIQKRAEQTVKCFVQVNVSREESKSGVYLEELEDFIGELSTFDKIQVVGLMTMAPHEAEEATLRRIFSQLRQARDSIQKLGLAHAPCTELSMGMSNDYLIACQEGATDLRIGRVLYPELGG